jgi:S1-C subfamily serine protease
MRTQYRLLFIVFALFTHLAQAEFVNIVAKIKPSVVGVGIHTPTSRPQNILRGTGFVIGDGHYVVTNAHVLPQELDENLLQKMAVFIGSGKEAKVRQGNAPVLTLKCQKTKSTLYLILAIKQLKILFH